MSSSYRYPMLTIMGKANIYLSDVYITEEKQRFRSESFTSLLPDLNIEDDDAHEDASTKNENKIEGSCKASYSDEKYAYTETSSRVNDNRTDDNNGADDMEITLASQALFSSLSLPKQSSVCEDLPTLFHTKSDNTLNNNQSSWQCALLGLPIEMTAAVRIKLL